ncbi:MAG: hypothetical protein AB2805_10695, partial [Candidatus Thiodiazotropha sp.]
IAILSHQHMRQQATCGDALVDDLSRHRRLGCVFSPNLPPILTESCHLNSGKLPAIGASATRVLCIVTQTR